MPPASWPSRQRAYRKRWEITRARGGAFSTSADPTRDRLRALARAGWPAHILGERLGISDSAVRQMQRGDRTWCRTITAARARQLFDELKHTTGPSARVATCAAKHEWPTVDDILLGPDLPDPQLVDEVKLDRLLEGERPELTRAERSAAIARLADRGHTHSQIADRIGASHVTVRRHLRLGVAS